MADVKKYYWLKLDCNFFNRSEIKLIESMKNGDAYLIFYIKLLLEGVKTHGILPNKKHKLSYITKTERSISNEALDLFIKYGLIEIINKDLIYLPYITKKTIYKSRESTGRDRNTTEYKLWRKSVFERDLYTCKLCNAIGGKLNAHHIKAWAKYPKLRFDVDNGITLCEECHKAIHKKLREVKKRSGRKKNVC